MQTAEPDFIFQSVYHQTRLVYTSDPLYLYLKKGFKKSDLWHCVITHNICFSVFLWPEQNVSKSFSFHCFDKSLWHVPVFVFSAVYIMVLQFSDVFVIMFQNEIWRLVKSLLESIL